MDVMAEFEEQAGGEHQVCSEEARQRFGDWCGSANTAVPGVAQHSFHLKERVLKACRLYSLFVQCAHGVHEPKLDA